MGHFINPLDILTNLIFLLWISEMLNSFRMNHLSTLVFFTFNIRVIQIRIILWLSRLLLGLCLYCWVVGWLYSGVGLFWSLIFGFVHFWQIQRITHRCFHFRSDRYLTSYNIKFTSSNHIRLQPTPRNKFSYLLWCLLLDISAKKNIIRPLK